MPREEGEEPPDEEREAPVDGRAGGRMSFTDLLMWHQAMDLLTGNWLLVSPLSLASVATRLRLHLGQGVENREEEPIQQKRTMVTIRRSHI